MKYDLAPGYEGAQMHMREDHFCHVCGFHKLKLTAVGMGAGTIVEFQCENCKAKGHLTNAAPWGGREMTEKDVDTLFHTAGIEVLAKWKIQNAYYGASADGRIPSVPWWLVKTNFGLIQLGWRKRVISIDWSDTPIRFVVTEDDVTKSAEYVHAYSMEDATKYMSAWVTAAIGQTA